MNLRARSELFGLILTVGRATAPQLIALARPLGLTASNVKSHLSRLAAEGIVLREGPTRRAVYSLTDKRQGIVASIATRLEEPPDRRWNGEWLCLAIRMPAARAERENLRAALWFDGFRPWGREVWLRPAWPMPWARAKAEGYAARGAWCVQGQSVGTLSLAAVQALYAVQRLDREAEDVAALIARKTRALRSDADAFAARQKLSGMAVDVIARDPRLPAELWPQPSGLARLRRVYRTLMMETKARAEAFVSAVMTDA
jgi:phenylacetic acid degradation operon negative regulatory protein